MLQQIMGGLGAAANVASAFSGQSGPHIPKWARRGMRDSTERLADVSRLDASQMVAGLTPDQLAALQRTREGVGMGAADLEAAQRRAEQLAGGVTAADIRGFYDPFENDVVRALQGDYREALDLNRMTAGDAARRAGAFGGDREAVYNAVLDRGATSDLGRTLAGVRSSGWTQAVNAAFQNQIARGAGNRDVADIIERRRSNYAGDTSALYGAGSVLQGQNQRTMDWRLQGAQIARDAYGQAFGAYAGAPVQQPRPDPLATGIAALQDGWKMGQSALNWWNTNMSSSQGVPALRGTPIGNPTVSAPLMNHNTNFFGG